MYKSPHIRFGLFLFFLAFSCEKIPLSEADASNCTWEEVQAQLEKEDLRSEQRFRHPSITEEQYQGAINAVKKAYQLTDITFTPLLPIAYNNGTYKANSTYEGMIYSSVKEIGTYVGTNVSFYTFMTALNNPRSVIYTERIDRSPYHGGNCRAYYGVVCSSLISYALGLFPPYDSYDFPTSEEMEEIDCYDYDGLHIADVLWRSGHVAMITDVVRDKNDVVISIELTEAVPEGTQRRYYSRTSFDKTLFASFQKAFRYVCLENNLDYTPVPEFVAVLNENPIVQFCYNNDICANKGDCANYLLGEDVVLNVYSPHDSIVVNKDYQVYSKIIGEQANDVVLSMLPYGFYEAYLYSDGAVVNKTSWIVVDVDVLFDPQENAIVFKSRNSIPVYAGFCTLSGSRNYPRNILFYQSITEKDIQLGRIYVPVHLMKKDCPYFQVKFKTKYGIVSVKPIKAR